MANRQKPVHRSALPVLVWIRGQKKMTEADFCANVLNISHGRWTNWKARGVPSSQHAAVARSIGKDIGEYLAEIGKLPPQDPKKLKVSGQKWIADFNELPDFLQAIMSKKISELRKHWEELPPWFKDKLTPPKDPIQYRQWELEIEDLILKFKSGN